ncbi:dihydroorotase [Actinomycetaceae bacterium TAE3-ERU4]|nr:dihydroorotase [Actinomycetaceae bacterium TAE3-ERU4]
MTSLLITNVKIEDSLPTDIAIEDGKILAVGMQASESFTDSKDIRVIDGTGLVALPGLVDLHTHLRQPGNDAAETVYTGTRSAAAGGYTCVHAMANTSPVADNALVVEKVQDLGNKAGFVEVRPVGSISKGLEGQQLSQMGSMYDSAARVRVFSDDGKCVTDTALMRRALEYAKGLDVVVAQHAQDSRLTESAQMNEGIVSGQLGMRGWPASAEEMIIARDVILAKHLDARLHVCHLSTRGSVEVVRWAKSMGVKVTAEVTPHHLALTDECARTFDSRFKVNPPLRTDSDRQALIEGLADGTIDVIATDHAPHPDFVKSCPWDEAAFGMTGLETALPVVIKELVEPGYFTWSDVARVMSRNPAAIGQVSSQGQSIEAGQVANLCLVNPEIRRVINPAEQFTKSTNSPFAGQELPGKVEFTFFRGKVTVDGGVPVES